MLVPLAMGLECEFSPLVSWAVISLRDTGLGSVGSWILVDWLPSEGSCNMSLRVCLGFKTVIYWMSSSNPWPPPPGRQAACAIH